MPVEIPRTARIDQAAPQSVGRIEVNAPDIAQASAPAMKGIQAGLGDVVKAQQDYANQVHKEEIKMWDVKSTDEATGFELWKKTRLIEIKNKTGDVTEEFANLEIEAEKKAMEISTSYKNMKPEFQQMLDGKIKSAYTRMDGLRNMQQADQAYKYSQTVHDSKAAISIDNVMNYGQYVDVKNPDTFAALNVNMNILTQNRISQFSKNGIQLKTRTDENGNETVEWEDNPVLAERVRKDAGDALVPLIKSLNNSGKVSEGKELIRYYDKFLNAADKAKLISGNDEANVKNVALAKIADFRAKNNNKIPSSEEINNTETFKDVSEAERFKISEISHTQRLHESASKKAKADDTFLDLTKYVDDRQRGKNPFRTASEMNSDPKIQNAFEIMSVDQITAIKKRADEGKSESNPDVVAELIRYNMTNTMGRDSLSDVEYEKLRSDLSQKDRKEWDAIRLKNNDPKTDPELRAAESDGVSNLMTRIKNLTDADGNIVFKGKGEGKDYVLDDQAMVNKLLTDIRPILANTSYKDQAAVIEKYVSQLKKEKEDYDKANDKLGLKSFFKGLSKDFKSNNPFSKNPVVNDIRPFNQPAPTVINIQATPASSDTTQVKTSASTNTSWSNKEWVDDFKTKNPDKKITSDVLIQWIKFNKGKY